MIRPAFVIGTLAFLVLACVGDEAVQGFTAPPTKEEYLATCGKGACKRTAENCTAAFNCQINLFSAYKTRDVMQCLKETEATEGCGVTCENRVAEVKYSTDAGNMIIACLSAYDDGKGKCKGFTCPDSLRLYRDDLLENLTKCYERGLNGGCDADPYAVVKCLNITAYAKAPACASACCSNGAFYACPSASTASACFDGATEACTALPDFDGRCGP